MDKPAAFRVKDATGKTVGELSDACADMVLGRGLCGVPSSDKRCSRKQAELMLGRNGSLSLVPRGVNPAYLKRAADKGGEAVMLQRNEKYTLEDGDVFTLVANCYPFTVLRCSQERPAKEAPMKTSLVAAPKRVEPVKEGAKPSIGNGNKKGQPASEQANQKKWKCIECTFLNEAYTTFCDMCEASKKESPPTAAPAAAAPKPTPPSSLGTKRKAQDDDEEAEDAPRRSASPERKRPKIDSEPEDERPVCPYGKACYRKNPAHFKENSHPWLEKKTKSMTTAKKPTAVADHRDGPAPAKPATKTEKPPKAYTSDSAGPPKEDIKKKKKEEAPKPSEYESKKPSPKIPKGGDWMDEVPPPAPKKIEKPKPAQPSTPAPSQSSSSGSKPSFSAPAQSQTTVSPSGKKTLKLIPPASPTKVAPGARLVLDYNSDEDEEEEIAPKQTGTSSSPQLKPPRPANVPVKKTPSLQSLAALLSQDERGSTSTSTSTSVTGKPKSGNTAKQPATDTTQTVSKALAGSLATAKGKPFSPPSISRAKSLAFPSFGTSMLGMQPKRAAAVIRKTAKKFLRARPDKDIRLVLVLEGKQDPVLVFFEEKGISDPRFTVATTPITKLDSVSLSSAFLATETDWRLRGGGTVFNRMVHEVAGPSLMQETKKLYSTASECGQVYPVPLPADSPLYSQQGVRAVVHCRPPNMNPAKPDCLNDEKEGKRLLKETYKRLFQFFGATLDLL